jgi:hypothetical protein
MKEDMHISCGKVRLHDERSTSAAKAARQVGLVARLKAVPLSKTESFRAFLSLFVEIQDAKETVSAVRLRTDRNRRFFDYAAPAQDEKFMAGISDSRHWKQDEVRRDAEARWQR